MNKTIESKSGSALLVTLLVVSLLLVVVVTFSAYVRLELRAVNARMELIQARQNAKLGMHLALARLQETAGADQRATATAGTLGVSNLHIAGVWDTQNPNTPPEWLISTPTGVNYDVTAAYPVSDSILLVGPGTLGESPDPDDVIRAPVVTISNPGTNGRYAFWVADEGVKASIGLYNPYPTAPAIGDLHTTEVDRLRYTVPVRNASEFAFIDPLDFEDPIVNSFVEYTQRLNQFNFLNADSNPQENDGFHTYTHNARGLLTDPVNGGIKKDLSLAPDLFPSPGNGFEQFLNYTSYLQEPDPGNFLIESPDDLRRLHLITPPSNLSPVHGEVVHSVVPIITDFGVQFSPHPLSSGNRRAHISMLFVLELWNPYTSGLEAEDLVVEIQGMQPITTILIDPNTDLEVWRQTFDVAATFGETIEVRLERGQYHTTTQFLGADSYDTRVHGPGRLLYWTGPDTNNNRTPDRFTGSFANRNSSNTRLVLPAVPAANFPSGNHFEVRYEMQETPLTVTVRHAGTNDILSIYDNFQYDEVNSGVIGTLGQWMNRWLTYRFRIIERGTTYLADRSAWLKDSDFRSPKPFFGDDITSDTHTMHEAAGSYSPDDSALRNYLSVNQEEERYYFDRVLSNKIWSRDYRRDIPLFELPRQPLISIGQLQHLYIHGMPPYSIGNPWGGTNWNSLFDDFFLSGIQLNISEPDFNGNNNPTLPHPRLSLTHPANLNLNVFDNSTLPDLGENSALAFHIEGHFNINSVSTEAWKTILASTRFADFRHMQRDTNMHDENNPSTTITDNIDYPAGFTRFPQSIQELFEVDTSRIEREPDRWNNKDIDQIMLNLKPGITFLYPRNDFTNTGVDSDYDREDTTLLDEFAEAIAVGIQQRVSSTGRPYFTLNEFITEDFQNGEPILEHLIEESGLRRIYTPSTLDPGDELLPEERTPSWLSQADILSALAPFLSTRSDTFTIRAYGDVVSPNNVTSSRAWCEAVVQRVITPVNPVPTLADMADAPDENFGRRFKIISFKWLSESEI